MLARVLLNGEIIRAESINGYFFKFLSLTCFSKKIIITNQGRYEA
ncbi:hypothetical protein PSOS111911_12635 [Pseudoalteromonas ostreae]